MSAALARAEPIRVACEENDVILEEHDMRLLERGEVSSSLLERARAAGGHELRLWRATSRGMVLVKTIQPDGVAEIVSGGEL